MSSEIQSFFAPNVTNGVVSWEQQKAAVKRFYLSPGDADQEILSAGWFPERFSRHMGILTAEQQLILTKSHVTVVGCGALGGHVILNLARMGIGFIRAIDPDRFEPSNLNRQPFCQIDTLGRSKARVVGQTVSGINPAVTVTGMEDRLDESNSTQLIDGTDVVVDGLDTIYDRQILKAATTEKNIPLVHGAVRECFGQAGIELPGQEGMIKNSEKNAITDRPPVLSFMPAAIASIQAALTMNLLIYPDNPSPLPGIFLDLTDMSMTQIPL